MKDGLLNNKSRYKRGLSTSPHLLDVIWALKKLHFMSSGIVRGLILSRSVSLGIILAHIFFSTTLVKWVEDYLKEAKQVMARP